MPPYAQTPADAGHEPNAGPPYGRSGPLYTVSGDRLIVLRQPAADGRAGTARMARTARTARWSAPYARLFAVPGAAAFTAGNLIARLPTGMFTVAAVMMIAGSRGSYALAGAVTASGLAATALVGPLTARLADRYGQRRVVVPAAGAAALGSLALAACVRWDAPDWTLFAAYAATATTPNTGGMARARWAYVHRHDAAARHTANSFEQAADELCFMLGPVLAALLCTAFFPEAGTLAGVVLLLTGVLLFAAQRSTEPPVAPRGTASSDAVGPGRSPVRLRGMPPLLVTFLCTGAVFGALEVVTLAYADELGHASAGGPVLALQATGSAVAGLAFGVLRPAGGAVVRRFVVCVCVMAGLMTLPLLATGAGAGSDAASGSGSGAAWSLALLAVALLVAGTGTAPTMVTGMTLIQRITPAARLNEGMTLAVTALLGGIAAGSAGGGWAAQHLGSGAAAGYWVPVAAAALAAASATVGFRHQGGKTPYNAPGPGDAAYDGPLRAPPVSS